MVRTLLVLAVLVPLVCFLLVKYQDGDFVLMIYKLIGENPAVALRGKVVWITGASSGIGEYLAYELAKCGCKLVLSARRKDELERVKKNCAAISLAIDPSFKKDQEILVLPLDLQKFDTHEKLAQDVLKHFGKVDILVNNGGRGQFSLIRKTSLEVDRAILDLNTVGTISVTKAILPHMIERHEGQIVIVSSLSGKYDKNLSL
ncbi:Dehydrogenase/reductase SDR member 7 [Porites harrisoni]